MKYRSLRIFVAAYEEKSLTGAARRLSVSQPQVSLAIKDLETDYHVKLTEPAGRGVRFTPAAQELYRHALPIIDMCGELDKTMRSWDTAGPLRIGSSISIGNCMMPGLVKEFEARHPDVRVYVCINSADIIEQMVLDNKLDFALIEGAVHSDRLVMEPYLEDELQLVCAVDDPLRKKVRISIEDIQPRKLLLRERNSATREIAENILTSRGMAVTPAWESSDTTALVAAVSLGLGLSILPRRFVLPYIEQKKIAPLKLEGADFKRTYNIIYLQNKYLSQVALDFLSLVDDREGGAAPSGA